MKRIYETLVKEHFEQYEQMLFLAGPRQVGKTTISLAAKTLTDDFFYFNWDTQEHRQLILKGPITFANSLNLQKLQKKLPIIVLDEIHKYFKWKSFLKGLYDNYKDKLKIIVTGSAKLDVYRTGGDSLMGRYFLYRVHPITIAECARTTVSEYEIQPPLKISSSNLEALWNFGGFPQPFLKANTRFANQWHRLREQQLFREDIRDLSDIQEISQLEILSKILQEQTGQLIDLSSLANKVNVSVNTIKRWLSTLERFYYCFLLKPWTKNVTRSLLKQPKLYLWDWSQINDPGARTENFIACHLLKAVHFWTDRGFGKYELYFIRDKEKNEVDFLVTKNQKPWFLVEAKHSDNQSISEALYRFQQQTKATHAFQVVFNAKFIDIDCFSKHEPIIVPAQTLLSQLI